MSPAHGQGVCQCEKAVEPALTQDLRQYIRLQGVHALNAAIPDSVLTLFKPYSKRCDDSTGCTSDSDDHHLIIHIPLTTPCKITSLCCIGGDKGQSPSQVKLFVNKEALDFTIIDDHQPTETLDLIEDFCGAVHYPLKPAKFSNVTHLTLYFTDTHGANNTTLYYLGLYGQGSRLRREPVYTVYEARANPLDHAIPDAVVDFSLGQS